MMIGRQVHLGLCEVASIELREVDVPVSARIHVGRRCRTVVDDVYGAVVGGNPGEDRRRRRSATNSYRGCPVATLIARAGEGNGVPVGPHRVEVAIRSVDGEGWEGVRQTRAGRRGEGDT